MSLDISITFSLEPLSGEEVALCCDNSLAEIRSDIKERDFWTRRHNVFFDARIFHQNAQQL